MYIMDMDSLSKLGIVKLLIEIKRCIHEWIVRSENFQKFLRTDAKFDVIIAETLLCEELLGLGQYFNAPIILLSPVLSLPQMETFSAVPSMHSYMPNIYNGHCDRMNFFERLNNMMTKLLIDLAADWIGQPIVQKRYERMFPGVENQATVKDLKQNNISLILLNSHPVITAPRPLPPNIVEIGGAAIIPDKEVLSADLQKILDEATDGVIYFSLGSLVNITRILTDGDSMVMNAFNHFPHIKFLIKSEQDIKVNMKKQENVHIQSWYPQAALLAHPNLIAFISHGGLNSIQESIYYGKPLIVVPFFFDQLPNGRLASERGYGINLPIAKLSEHTLKAAIEEILTDSRFDEKSRIYSAKSQFLNDFLLIFRYTEQAKLTSEYYRDRLASPLETALHYIKHVAKNKGAPHLHSPAVQFPTYVFYNLDVWGLIFTVLLISSIILIVMCRFIFNRIIRFLRFYRLIR